MNLDLYTFAAFAFGLLAGAITGIVLARFVFSSKTERLERKVSALSDQKFKVTGQRVSLKQLEQRLDEEAAAIPVAEAELNEKAGEIRELTAALNETTALTTELSNALRTRKAKLQQLQVEQSKWLKRNKALLIKTEAMDKQLQTTQKEFGDVRRNATNGNGSSHADVAATTNGSSSTAAPSAEGVDRLASRMQEMESELEGWFHRLGKLEANVTGQANQANGLAMLEEVLRGEADKQSSAANGSSSSNHVNGNGSSQPKQIRR